MGTSTLRQTAPERPPQSVYWRRRFIALLIGLTIVALVTWAVAGALGGGPAPPGSSSATKGPGGAPLGRASSAPAGHPAPSGGQATGRTSTSGSHGLKPCPAGDVVLSIFSSQASYSVRQTPEFEVDVVSTDSHTCTFDIGAAHVLLEISQGSTRVWTSADCAEGQASLVTRLHRGVPTVVPIAWNGQHSSAGCPVPGAPAAAGTYSAVASDGSSTSNSLSFGIG